jgi:hypothetical protein
MIILYHAVSVTYLVDCQESIMIAAYDAFNTNDFEIMCHELKNTGIDL